MSEARPFIKWVGGKTQLLSELRKHIPAHFGAYHEPFLGGGALFFDLAPRRAFLSDANELLVRTYLGVQGCHRTLTSRLSSLFAGHCRDQYYEVRARDPLAGKVDETAAWFIYLNKTGFNGLFRVNKSGKFNVPIGRYVTAPAVDARNLAACAYALGCASIAREDFRGVESRVEPGDFVYFDPPYVPVDDTADFTSYTAGGFGMRDQVDLRDMALRMKDRGVHVLLSNAGVNAVAGLYAHGFEIHEVEARRSVNCKGGKRGVVKEFLIR